LFLSFFQSHSLPSLIKFWANSDDTKDPKESAVDEYVLFCTLTGKQMIEKEWEKIGLNEK